MSLIVDLRRESGVIATTAKFVREFVGAMPRGYKLLGTLSRRYRTAAKELGLRQVPRVFQFKHGRLTSTHYRTMAEVLQVITCDLIPPASPLGQVIAATTRWYWACRAAAFATEEDVVEVDRLGTVISDAWIAFDTDELRATFREDAKTPAGRAVDLPKFHRAITHMPAYIRSWGPYEFITTETSESMHKPLKLMFKR